MNYDEETKKAFKVLLDKNALGAGILYTPNCYATYEELKAKGVVFTSEPKEQFTVLKRWLQTVVVIGLA
jgi:hypothetical protein